MKHEKIIRRDDGSRVKIEVLLSLGVYSDAVEWRFATYKCEKGKRTWQTAIDPFAYELRGLADRDKKARERHLKLQLATEEEVEAVMLELLAKIKPVVS
jgi:hypothetical protein